MGWKLEPLMTRSYKITRLIDLLIHRIIDSSIHYRFNLLASISYRCNEMKFLKCSLYYGRKLSHGSREVTKVT